MEKYSVMEQFALDRERVIPKPNVLVTCKRCASEEKKPLSTIRAHDFFWRYYKCLGCFKNYWVGVQFDTQLTVFTISTPRVDSFTQLTGNLKYILPAGHPAVTREYDQFLSTGQMPKAIRHAKQDAIDAANAAAAADFGNPAKMIINFAQSYPDRAAEMLGISIEQLQARLAHATCNEDLHVEVPLEPMQVNEEPTTPELSNTFESNDEAPRFIYPDEMLIDAAYHDFLEELADKAIKPQHDQILPLFNAWLAHFHPELQTKEEPNNG